MTTILIIVFALGLGFFIDDNGAYENREKERRKNHDGRCYSDRIKWWNKYWKW